MTGETHLEVHLNQLVLRDIWYVSVVSLISVLIEYLNVFDVEPKKIYRAFSNEVPDGTYEVPIGEAATRREGSDISVFCWGAMTRPTLEAAENLAGEIDVEVVDLRTLSPIEKDAIIESFTKTGRAAVHPLSTQDGRARGEITSLI